MCYSLKVWGWYNILLTFLKKVSYAHLGWIYFDHQIQVHVNKLECHGKVHFISVIQLKL